MSENILSQIEERVSRLSFSEQLRLIERLVHRLHDQAQKQQVDRDAQLAQMAADPEIQAEMTRIAEEFSVTEADGLESR